MSRDGKIHLPAPRAGNDISVIGIAGSMSWHLLAAHGAVYTVARFPIAGASMVSRRQFLAASAAGGIGLWSAAARSEAVMTDDGFYREDWFLESFLELSDDLVAATAAKKRLALMWELRGCPYCRQTHLVNFAKPEITSYIKARFEILQLNIIGSREVTDFDGAKLTEKR